MKNEAESNQSDIARLALEELKELVTTGRLSVPLYYKELDRRGISHA